jgi:hypothetical protein
MVRRCDARVLSHGRHERDNPHQSRRTESFYVTDLQSDVIKTHGTRFL